MKSISDLSRLRVEYQDRERRLAGRDLYSPFNPANLFSVQQRARAVMQVLKGSGYTDLADLTILEVGCGTGGVLTEFLGFGARPQNLYGLDLLEDRLFCAKERLPITHFLQANGCQIPFPEGSFDLLLQYTAISSILAPDLRRQMCAEMLRVTKPGGLILSYDFWLNPTNRQTRGLRMSEIRASFAGCRIEPHRITLAPPITRKLASYAWGLCLFLESLKIFNTHYLAAISKISPD
jgi:ubiquinone/menaquinone biosynthesis C-methylase UbiE